MDRLAANDAWDGSCGSVNMHALSRQGGRIVSTNGGKIKKALFINVANEKSKFVAMRCEHNARLTGWIERGNHVSMHVSAYFISIMLYLFSNNLLHRLLKARWAWTGDHAT